MIQKNCSEYYIDAPSAAAHVLMLVLHGLNALGEHRRLYTRVNGLCAETSSSTVRSSHLSVSWMCILQYWSHYKQKYPRSRRSSMSSRVSCLPCKLWLVTVAAEPKRDEYRVLVGAEAQNHQELPVLLGKIWSHIPSNLPHGLSTQDLLCYLCRPVQCR